MAKLLKAELVSREELFALAKAEADYAAATLAASEAKTKLEPLRLALAEKVLGEAAADLKTMDPEHVDQLMTIRANKKLWRTERNSPPFVFVKTWSGSVPAWKEKFIEHLGEALAARIAADTPKTYAYKIEVAA